MSQQAARARTQPPDPPVAKIASVHPGPLTPRGWNTRNKLVVAARAVFSRAPFSEVKITDITAEAGVASGTFYTYFESKDEIFAEVAAQVLEEMSAAAADEPDNPEQRDIVRDIEYSTRRYYRVIYENRQIARSIEEIHAGDGRVTGTRRSVLVKGVKRADRWIQRLQREGLCDPELETWPIALALHAMNVSVGYDHLVHRDAPEETEMLIRATTRIWQRAVGLPDAPNPGPG